MKKRTTSLVFLFLIGLGVFAQNKFKIPDVYYEWNKLKNAQISRHGKIITYQIDKLKGDKQLHYHFPDRGSSGLYKQGYKAKVAPNESFFAFRIKPSYDTLRKLELKDVSKKKYPKDSLGIHLTETGKSYLYPNVKSFKIPKENKDWIAWLEEKPEKQKKEKSDSAKTDSTQTDSIKEGGHDLIVMHPVDSFLYQFDHVKEYTFSRNGKLLVVSQEIEYKEQESTISSIYIFNTETRETTSMFNKQRGKITEIAVSRDGENYAFIFTDDTTEVKDYNLYFNNKKIADSSAAFLKNGWQISANSKLNFSKNGHRLVFETSPVPDPEPKDTLTKDETYHVDIWHWKDRRLQPQQKKQKKQDKKRDYKAFYNIKKKEFLQVETEELRHVYVLNHNKSDHAFAFDRKPYQRSTSWTGRRFRDVYYINLKKNTCRCILKKHDNRISFSPNGRFAVFYSESDSSWFSIDIQKERRVNLTKNLNIPFYNIKNDMPIEAKAYGVAGWDKNQFVYIYDRYDIWKIDASGKKSPLNLTKSYGRKNNMRFRYIKTDPEAIYLPDTLLLSLFHQTTKDAGYAHCLINRSNIPEILIKGPFKNYGIKKSRKSHNVIFRKGNFKHYPELYLTTFEFDTIEELSTTNPQQENYRWGTVELTNWISASGDSLSGLLYKPENFDPDKKHPMIVYFYERYAEQLHAHYIPKPSHSVINFTRYLNDGYIIFIPDIKYRTGYPGKSAEDAVLSGTLHIINKGFVDRDRIGLQGQSWGGYQVAHLVTRTDLYAAAMAGAPVSNMTSAYGGIRWGSGMSRAFQYEQTQSRIGGSLWEKPLHYIENSPLFFAPDVNTPVLMMHNDHDGAVPWYQSIEFFNALRRLNKTAYLLVYNNDKHNLRHWGNRIDLSIRMKQFFDYYLNSSPMPVWMKYGIPAIDKNHKTGYKLTD